MAVIVTALWTTALACLILAVAVRIARAEDNNAGAGFYALTADGWPCAASLETFDGVAVPRLSILAHTFGDNKECLNEFLSDPRPKLLEIHLINSTCQSNNRCGNYEFLKGISVAEFDKRLRQRDKATLTNLRNYASPIAQYLLPRLGNTDCNISVFLEDPYSNAAMQVAIETVRPIFPGCHMVRSPRGVNPQKALAGADIIEGHGSRPRVKAPCIVNLDGEDIDWLNKAAILPNAIPETKLAAYLERYKFCKANFLWTAGANGIRKGGFIDPRKRNGFPDRGEFANYGKYLRGGAAPLIVPAMTIEDEKSFKGCRRRVKKSDGPGGFLWKQSDVHRGAVALFPSSYDRFRSVSVVHRGKVLDRLSYAGTGNPDKDGRPRQHWRSAKPTKNFPFNVVLKADGVCWPIPAPQIRQD